MLQKIRDKTHGLFANIVMGILIAVFALWGVDTLIGNIMQSTPKLTVNGDEIPATEVDRLVQRKTQELLVRLGKNADPAQVDELVLRESAINELVQRKLLEQAASNNGMGVALGTIDRRIARTADFQIDGKYDETRATQVLQSGGFTPASYRATLGREVQLNQQLATYSATGFWTQDQVERLAALVHQKRTFRYVALSVGRFTDAATVSDKEIEDYYQQHQANFQQEEQVAIEYVLLDKKALAETIKVSDEQLQAAYKDEAGRFQAQTERRASHILLAATSDQELAAARKQADIIKSRLAKGEDFGKLAAEFSQDTGSAKSGGDIGYSTGNGFTEDFEAALRKLKINEISEPVKTEFGIHLIKLTELKETSAESFDARKEALTRDLQKKLAEEQFKSRSDELKTLAFESPDLIEPAKKLELKRETTPMFGRNGGAGIAAEAAVKKAAFTVEVKDQGLNSELLMLDEGRSAVVRAIQHQPGQVRPLDTVKGEVEVVLRQQKATEQAKQLGEAIVASLQEGKAVDELLTAQKALWSVHDSIERNEPKLNPLLTDKIFALPRPSTDKSVISGFSMPGGDYIVVELKTVSDGTMTDLKTTEADSIHTFLSQQAGVNALAGYVKSLEARAKIKGKESQLAVKDPLQ